MERWSRFVLYCGMLYLSPVVLLFVLAECISAIRAKYLEKDRGSLFLWNLYMKIAVS